MPKLLVALGFATALAGVQTVRPTPADAASTCSVATGKAANVLCWLDLSAATLSPNTPNALTWTLPDGSTMTGTVTQTGTTTPPVGAIPTYGGASLGNTAYTGVGGKPAVYSGGVVPTTLSNVQITDPQGNLVPSATIAGADAETLDTGDGSGAYLQWTTSGTAWAQLQIMNSKASNGPTPICTLTGLGTATASCVPSSGGNNAGYILTTNVTPSQSISMAFNTSSLQGYAFAVNLASLSLSKTITSRVANGDQFTIVVSRNGVAAATATTSGNNTGTGQATATVSAMPSETYTLSETSSGTSLAQYASSIACTNATTSSSTTLPSGYGTSFTVTPAANDQIVCTFTNVGLTSTNAVVNATKSIAANTSTTDSFTAKNTSAVAAYVGGAAPALTTSSNATIAPTGYTYGGSTYATWTALLAAVDASATAANASVTIGVVYTTPATQGTVNVSFTSDVTLGGSTSAVQTATETDTNATAGALTVFKSGTMQTSPGGLVAYSIFINNATTLLNYANATFSDPVPSGMTIKGTPTCVVTSGSASCPSAGNITVSGNTVSATIPNLPPSSSETFYINAAAGAGPSYTNTASVTPALLGGAVTSSLTTTVSQSNGLTKTVANLTQQTAAGTSDNAVPGDQLQYGLNFLNTTGATISNVVLADPLPASVTFSSASCGTLPAGVTSCSISAPAAGATGTVTFTYAGSLASSASLAATINVYVK